MNQLPGAFAINPHPDEGALLANFQDSTKEERAFWDAFWDACFAAACTRATDSVLAHRLANAALMCRRRTFPTPQAIDP